jgi:hypothetical protein
MEERYLKALPGELQSVVAEAEDKAGCHIEVVPDTSAAQFDNLKIQITRDGRCEAIISFAGAEMSRCALIHEVLHIKRYWIEQVPILRSIGRQFDAQAEAINELLEHLVIIPEERKYVPDDSNEHWGVLYQDGVRNIPLPVYPWIFQEDLWKRSLLQWRALRDIAMPFLSDALLLEKLEAWGLKDASGQFVSNLNAVHNNKIEQIPLVVREFEWPPSEFCIRKFNLAARPWALDLI